MTGKAATAVIAATGILLFSAANAQGQGDEIPGPRDENAFDRSIGYELYLAGSDLRASELVGAEVRNSQDERLGEIEDLIVSRDDDVITAVISVGGFLDIGDKLVGVPYQDLRVSASGDTLYLSVTEEELKAQPAFEYEPHRSVDELGDRSDAARSRAGFDSDDRTRSSGTDRARSGAGDAAAVAADRSAARSDAVTRSQSAARSDARQGAGVEGRNIQTMNPGSHRASDLIGLTVVDNLGEEVGAVDDLIVSADGGLQAVLAMGGIIGISERLIAVPIEDLEIDVGDADDDEAVVRLARSARQLMDSNAEFSYELRAAARVR